MDNRFLFKSLVISPLLLAGWDRVTDGREDAGRTDGMDTGGGGGGGGGGIGCARYGGGGGGGIAE